MKFKIEIDCKGAAFDGGDLRLEIARLLKELGEDVYLVRDPMDMKEPNILRDINGNVCGSAVLTDDDESPAGIWSRGKAEEQEACDNCGADILEGESLVYHVGEVCRRVRCLECGAPSGDVIKE